MTRHKLLELQGYHVTSALGFSEAQAQCSGDFSLFLLGHSVPVADKRKLISSFRANCRAPIVSLLGPDGEESVDGADYYVSAAYPAELLQRILAIVSVYRGTGERLAISGDGSLVEYNPYLRFRERPWIRELLVSTIFAGGADFGNVQLFDSSDRALRIVTQHGFDSKFLSHFETVRDHKSACGTAMRSRSRVVIMDVASDPIFEGNGSRDVLLQANARSLQSTPLINTSGNFIGVLSTHYDQPNKPSPDTLERLDRVIATLVPKI